MPERRDMDGITSAMLLDSISDGIVIGFPDGPLQMNRAARVALGETGFELRAEDGRDIAAGDSPMDRALRGETVSGTYSQRDLERGTERAYRLEASPIRDAKGAVVAGLVAMHDLTEQRESERQKDEFLSIVSHELKTPLTPLKALAQLLRLRMKRHREDGRALDLDSLDANLRIIERQVDRMAGLVNDLLEVSRAGRGRFELQPQEFDLIPLIREVAQRYSELGAEDGRHTFAVSAPDSLLMTGDTMRIEQAVTNLVGNAVKYSPSGGEVRIAVVSKPDTVAISVADHGIGIPAGDLPALGKPFARGSSRAHTFSGMGIGLYLARLVAEGHGGSLALASPGEDQGTTVTLELPRTGTSG
jgi:signal transduction histidine kinase